MTMWDAHHSRIGIVGLTAIAWLALSLGGCSRPSWQVLTQRALPTAAGDEQGAAEPRSADRGKFRWDGGGVVLGEADDTALTVEEFKAALRSLHAQQRARSFRNLARKYPDLMLETMQSIGTAEIDDPSMIQLAHEADGFLASSAPYFATLFEVDRAQLGPHLDLRAKFWSLLRSGQPEAALHLKLVPSVAKHTCPCLHAEALRLTAIAHMMSGETDAALRALQGAMDVASRHTEYLATKLALLEGEFQRHAGQTEAWQAAWQRAVNQHAGLVAQSQLADPHFWHRAAFARPARMDWPAEATGIFAHFLRDTGIMNAESNRPSNEGRESLMWAAVGCMHLDRDEGQSAVLSFKKSEALQTDRPTIHALQLYQARGLILAGQPGPASSILIRLIAEQPKSALASRAQAVLGAIKVQNGAIAQGRNLLQTALESSEQWPALERLLAEADLALVQLLAGDEAKGLDGLSAAGEHFLALDQWDHAYQSLWNQARYFELTAQPESHRRALRQLEEFENLTSTKGVRANPTAEPN